ncbi:hypothetical protein C5U48_02795 [Mycolicibacter virginiensis]|uniref:Uncharacterized protein n=1 Tax=Mycolicibacter virginiensis TaxID=1795032 RepID=A0A9X7IQX6_9MYCO|nr:hypothetical protein [Mycolicibacter virginiensis]PQM53751.1 hypothetical protein C5U48_02795 [Mycolicibacter virginiensis]
MSTDVAEIRRAARDLATEQGLSSPAITAAADVAGLRFLRRPISPARRELIAPYGTVAWLNQHWSEILTRAGIAEDPR